MTVPELSQSPDDGRASADVDDGLEHRPHGAVVDDVQDASARRPQLLLTQMALFEVLAVTDLYDGPGVGYRAGQPSYDVLARRV